MRATRRVIPELALRERVPPPERPVKPFFVRNWRHVLKRAWSVRWMGAAAVFSGLEVALPLLDGILPIPRTTFAVISGACVALALVTRFIAQGLDA
jgi:hypothetical protein